MVGASRNISDTRCYPSGRLGDVSNASGWVAGSPAILRGPLISHEGTRLLDHPAADANVGGTDNRMGCEPLSSADHAPNAMLRAELFSSVVYGL
jgi:hypothetical protein